jgi:hypothetical protein
LGFGRGGGGGGGGGPPPPPRSSESYFSTVRSYFLQAAVSVAVLDVPSV